MAKRRCWCFLKDIHQSLKKQGKNLNEKEISDLKDEIDLCKQYLDTEKNGGKKIKSKKKKNKTN